VGPGFLKFLISRIQFGQWFPIACRLFSGFKEKMIFHPDSLIIYTGKYYENS